MDSLTAMGNSEGMSQLVDQRPQRVPHGRAASWTPATALFWRLFVVNGLVLLAGVAVLVVSPVTVSAPVVVTEVAILTVGLVLMLAVNALLVRTSLRPLDGLTSLMKRVDLLRPGERLAVSSNRDVAYLIHTFNEMLDRLEAERAEASAQALSAQERERQRIARELHDEIGQSLTAALLSLKQTMDRASEEVREELRVVQETIRGSLDEVRQVARRLRPGVLEDLGLLSAISALATDFAEASKIPVDRWLDGQLPALNSSAELVLYRIAQESLTNIARHANASRVELSLTGKHHSVVLRIADNGRGLDGSKEGAGIRGMRERALLIGAQLSIDPRPAGGTEVRLVVQTHIERG